MKPQEEEIRDEEIEAPQTEIEQLSDHLREYVGIRRELFELRLWDKLFGTTAKAISWIIIIFLGIISFFLLSAGIAWWVGTVIGEIYAGFLIVAAGFGLLAATIFLLREKLIVKPIADRFIEQLINEDDDNEDEDETGEVEDQRQKAA